MLIVAQPYFQRDDFRWDMVLHAAFPHPLLRCLVRFECGPDSLMRTDDRAECSLPVFSSLVSINAIVLICAENQTDPLPGFDTN